MPRPSRLSVRALLPPPPPPGRGGDCGVLRPNDAVWPVARERLVLLGGPAALLLQVAHPLVASAVAAHSGYRADPAHRLLATLQATLTITFGDTSQARQAARAVSRRHAAVSGTMSEASGRVPAGTPYRATDPHLALWVHSTLVWTALTVHERYVEPLRTEQLEAYWEQSKPFARLFGASGPAVPADWDAFTTYWMRTVSTLEVTPAARAIAADVLRPRLSPPLPGVGCLIRAITADLLPFDLRNAYELQDGPSRRRLVRALQGTVRGIRPVIPDRCALWPHYAVARARVDHGREPPVVPVSP